MNKVDILKITDYSVDLQNLSSDKLKKMIDITTDHVYDLKQELQETEEYLARLKEIINNRGE